MSRLSIWSFMVEVERTKKNPEKADSAPSRSILFIVYQLNLTLLKMSWETAVDRTQRGKINIFQRRSRSVFFFGCESKYAVPTPAQVISHYLYRTIVFPYIKGES